MPTLREFEYLVAVAEHGSITAAAGHLHVTQSALSQAILELERDFGGPLLRRDARGASLTAAARAALPEARLALSAAARAKRLARSVSGLDGGDIRIACAPSVAAGVMPSLIRQWQRRYPGVQVKLEECTQPDQAIESVRSGRSDLLVGAGPPTARGLEVHRFAAEELLVVVATTDPAAQARLASIADLADRRWVRYDTGHPMDIILRQLAAEAGFTLLNAVQVSETLTAPILASAGLGPALVPQTALLALPGARSLLRIGEGLYRDIMIATKATDNLTARFIDSLMAHGIPALPQLIR